VLYLPDKAHLTRFNQLSWSLPPKLLPWLYSRGLGIYVLPANREDAKVFVSKHLRIADKKLAGDGRKTADTSHYRPDRKTILLTSDALFYPSGENILLHELGHAIDFLYYGGGKTLSEYPSVKAALRLDKPLNDYCRDKYKKSNKPFEQFATAFTAYFVEPSDNTIPTVDDLSFLMVRIIRERLIKPFE
jgi:hypothetical protein